MASPPEDEDNIYFETHDFAQNSGPDESDDQLVSLNLEPPTTRVH